MKLKSKTLSDSYGSKILENNTQKIADPHFCVHVNNDQAKILFLGKLSEEFFFEFSIKFHFSFGVRQKNFVDRENQTY